VENPIPIWEKEMKFYKDKRGKWRWRVTGENGEIIGSSSQGFASRRLAKTNANLLAGELAEFVRSQSTKK
jgi:uncharacterized protein YegP (UPF0339 family)